MGERIEANGLNFYFKLIFFASHSNWTNTEKFNNSFQLKHDSMSSAEFKSICIAAEYATWEQ